MVKEKIKYVEMEGENICKIIINAFAFPRQSLRFLGGMQNVNQIIFFSTTMTCTFMKNNVNLMHFFFFIFR